MNDCLEEDTIKVISRFLPVLNRMNANKRNELVRCLTEIGKYGVEGFSKRIIYNNGYSSMFCTSKRWAEIKKDSNFLVDFRNHISPELVSQQKNKDHLVSRSKDKLYTPFLRKLDDAGVNNSIITTTFFRDRIELIYLMANPDRPQDRDLILNNIDYISFLQKQMQPALDYISQSVEFKESRELLLNESAMKILWNSQNCSSNSTDIWLEGKRVSITYGELQCLAYLRFGSSNRFISEELNVSVETVKSHLSNLKSKLSIEDRGDLIEIAKLKALIKLSKTLGIYE